MSWTKQATFQIVIEQLINSGVEKTCAFWWTTAAANPQQLYRFFTDSLPEFAGEVRSQLRTPHSAFD